VVTCIYFSTVSLYSWMITNAPWYVTKQTLHDDLKIPFIKDVIQEKRINHHDKLRNQSNPILLSWSSLSSCDAALSNLLLAGVHKRRHSPRSLLLLQFFALFL
jgi:hypothetical protein